MKCNPTTLLLLLLLLLCATQLSCAAKPNIIYVLADDLGYADIGYHQSDIPTPNLVRLASQGIKLENYYVQLVCTPSRASLMTGRYPIRYGLQHSVIQAPQPVGLSLNETTLAQKMKETGYTTHAFGKWHLGFYDIKYTPTYRGFDSFVGFYNGEEDYLTHIYTPNVPPYVGFTGYDFRNNTQRYDLLPGEFSSDIFERETLRVISNHVNEPVATRKPFFIYLAMQTPHAPVESRPQIYSQCLTILDQQRRLYCGLVVSLDQNVANIESALKSKGIFNNTLIVFSNDNGGWNLMGGYNYPLRSSKFTNFEGGIRGVSFVVGAGVPESKKNTVYRGLMHMTDWFPTLLNVAGGNTTGTQPLDGVDQWDALTNTGISPRTEILHNSDEISNNSAIRVGDWKLIIGQQPYDGYFRPLPNLGLPYTPQNPFASYTYLFNIADDPNEQNNLVIQRPDKVAELQIRLAEYNLGRVPALNPPSDPNCNPLFYNLTWTPWVTSS